MTDSTNRNLLPGLKPNESNTKDHYDRNSYSYLMEVLTGVIISDGSLVKKYKKPPRRGPPTGAAARGGTYLKFAQSVIHTGYFMVVFNFFANQGLCNMAVPSVCTANVKGKSYQYLQFSTKSLAE